MSPAPPRPGLALADLAADPVEEFARWFAAAEAEPGIVFAEAVCLSTLGPDGTPEGRMVLMKHFDARGFVFYTNLDSHKGRALREHPRAGMTFYWQPLGRQVRIRGPVEPVSPGDADAYFASRPRESRIGAWASDQSRELASRKALERRVEALEARFADGDVPRPPHWSGFRLVPEAIEFWHEGRARLHDRFIYEPDATGGWTRRRLYP